VKPNIRFAPGQPTTVDIHVIHLPRGVKTPLSFKLAATIANDRRERAGKASQGRWFPKRNQVRRLTDAPDFSVCPDRA
jgi:hypothetical protein